MGKGESAWTTVLGLLALVFFVLTLRPDVGGPEDSPKFQFVGHVLGTAHSPGYPLYVVLTYLFGWLPVGNLAFRINLFSAVCAAVACALTYLIARALNVSRPLAAVVTLALATGAGFWHNAIVAEVYALAAALVAAVVLLLLGWDGSPGRGRLYAACAVFAAGLGNHLTLAGVLPAALVYGVVRDRTVLAPRVIAAALAIGLLGVSQYALIIVRTVQHAPYLEARATSIPVLVDVMMAKDQSYARFQYSGRDLIVGQVPALLSAMSREMTWPGLLLAAAGAIAGLVRRQARVTLVAGAVAGMLAIVLNLFGDTAGFITPVMVLLWPLAAVGLEELARTISATRAWPHYVIAVASLAILAFHIVANRVEIGAYRDTSDIQPLRSLYAALPSQAVVVADNFWTARVLDYLHFSGEYTPDPAPRVIAADAEAVRTAAAGGSAVFAVESVVPWFESQGLAFTRQPLAAGSMAAMLRELPTGTLVAVASAGRALPVEWLPDGAAAVGGRPAAFGTMTWVVGTTASKIDQRDASVSTAITHGAATSLRLESGDGGVFLKDGGGILAAVDRGLVVAAVSPQGEVTRRWSFDAIGSIDARLDSATGILAGELSCTTLRTGESADVSSVLAGGGWVAALDRPGKATVLLQSSEGRPRLRHRLTVGRGEASVEHTKDGIRLAMTQTGAGRSAFALSLPTTIGRYTATLEPGPLGSVLRVCQAVPPPIPATGALNLGDTDHRIFAGGWHDPERANLVRFRWAEKASTMLLLIDKPGSARITLAVSPAAGVTKVDAAMNGHPAGSCALAARWNDCRFEVPASAMVLGVNRLTLNADRAAPPSAQDRRELAVAVQSALIRIGQ